MNLSLCQLNKNYKIMSQIYYCFVRDHFGRILKDGFGDKSACLLSSLDFRTLIDYGYSIEIFDFCEPLSCEYHERCLRRSHIVTRFVIKHNKLPLIKSI